VPTRQTGDAEELTTVLRNLLDSPERRYQLGIAGRQRAVDVYSWESVAAQTVSVYQRAIERSRAC
jgi:glycosyltransferase involved in cell wall biosynthesis